MHMYPIFKQEAAKKAGQLHISCVNCCVRVNLILYCIIIIIFVGIKFAQILLGCYP